MQTTYTRIYQLVKSHKKKTFHNGQRTYYNIITVDRIQSQSETHCVYYFVHDGLCEKILRKKVIKKNDRLTAHLYIDDIVKYTRASFEYNM